MLSKASRYLNSRSVSDLELSVPELLQWAINVLAMSSCSVPCLHFSISSSVWESLNLLTGLIRVPTACPSSLQKKAVPSLVISEQQHSTRSITYPLVWTALLLGVLPRKGQSDSMSPWCRRSPNLSYPRSVMATKLQQNLNGNSFS